MAENLPGLQELQERLSGLKSLPAYYEGMPFLPTWGRLGRSGSEVDRKAMLAMLLHAESSEEKAA